MRKINVCRFCEERYLGCHDHCEKYKEAYKQETARMDKAKQEMLGDREHLCYLREDKRKRQKRKGK